MTPVREQPLVCDADALGRVRGAFRAADFTSTGIERLLGTTGSQLVKSDFRQWPRWTRRAAGDTPIATLARTFLFGDLIPCDRFVAAVPLSTIDDWVGLGLLASDGNTARACWRIVPFGAHLYVLHAPWVAHADHRLLTMAPSPSSEKLAQLTIRQPIGSALDIGTGSGYQAFQAVAHCKQVVATDTNPHALAIARFTAALNGLSVEFLEGDCFDPVAGRTFDLIVSNPPFVVSPGEQHVWRDSGEPGDQISERIVREAPAHLNSGGFAHILINFVQRAGEDWRKRLQSWVQGSGCDMYALVAPPEDPGIYATAWIAEEDGRTDRFRQKFDEWMAFFERERVEKIYGAAVVLRKREGRNWFISNDAPGLTGDAGDAILGEFERFDYLSRTNDAQLLSARFRVSPILNLTQTLEPGEGGWKPRSMTLKLRTGLMHGGTAGGNIVGIISNVRPDRTLGSVIQQMAEAWKAPAESVAAAALPQLREMIFQGMLLPEPAE